MNPEDTKSLKVLYLFNGGRAAAYQQVQKGENPGDGFWGMVRLPHYGIEAEYLEVEQIFSESTARSIRRRIPVHFIHVFFFWKLFRYDVVFTSAAFGLQFLWTMWPGKKPLWVMHDFSITSLIGDRKTFRQRLFAYMVARCSGIVTVGKDETEKLKVQFAHLVDRITYITFGVDQNFFRPRDLPKNNDVLAVGFDPDRDWKTLLEAVRELNVSTVLATRPSRIAHLTVPANVKQTTFTPSELAEAYAKAEIFVLPLDTHTGVNDAMGCSTLFEAMASGCAIIASDTHTMRSYVTDEETALLVPERDSHALRAAIQRLQGDRDLRERLGMNARAYAVRYLDSEMLARELAHYFFDLAGRKTASS